MITNGWRKIFDWTDERTAILRRMWEEGYTAQEIADHFGGITRCSVLGKIHRLKLPRRDLQLAQHLNNRIRVRREQAKGITRQLPGTYNTANGQKRSQAGKIAPPLPMPPEGPKSPRAVKFEDLTAESCRYGHGGPREPGFTFCGEPVIPGTSWCACHHKRVFVERPTIVERPRYHIVRQVTFYDLEKA